MLGKKSNEKPCRTIDALIGANVEFRGNITFSGGLRIDGKVKGNVTARGAGNSTLILSENAEVHGNVSAPHVISNGKIRGHLRCAERVELEPQAQVLGDVHYKLISIAQGATVHGHLVRDQNQDGQKGVVTALKPATRPQEKAR